jgi:anion-transporting  ArsA/GET3 family ATPase
MLGPLVAERRVLVCAGPGGVGKTTTAAALGALAARLGRRTLVCTIDPAPRLADALGLGTLAAEPRPLSDEARRGLGIEGPGELWAARLDTADAFRRLVESQVPVGEMRRRIFENAIYRQITTSLTGSQEYAATLALHDHVKESRYDLVVLDTPPTANALDFLEAPRRIADAATSPALRWFARPTEKAGLFSLQRLRAGGALMLQRLGKFVGSQFLEDIGAFLADFHQVLGGFLDRARAIEALLRRPEAGFLLVMAPERPAMNEALYFHDKLAEAKIALDAFIANRVLIEPGARGDDLHARVQAAGVDEAVVAEGWPLLRDAAEHLHQVAAAQRAELDRLARRAPDVRILEVPLLAEDVSSLAALRTVSDRLAAG